MNTTLNIQTCYTGENTSEETTMPDTDLALYRAYRSTALWFARLNPAPHSITTHNGTISFSKGENFKWANYWLEQCRDYWGKLQSAPAVEVSCTGTTSEMPTSVNSVNSIRGTECLCPDCLEKEIKRLQEAQIDEHSI